MCSISHLLNPKPATEYPCEMVTIEAGQRMKLGHGYKLLLAAEVDASTNIRTERFVIEPHKGFPHMLKIDETIDVDKIYNENTGVRITPISKTYDGSVTRVNLFIELTRALNQAG